MFLLLRLVCGPNFEAQQPLERPGRLLNVLYTLNLCPVPRGYLRFRSTENLEIKKKHLQRHIQNPAKH